MPSRSCRSCIGLGILVSALVHGLGLAWVLGHPPALPAGGQETGLELDLALFTPVSGGETPVARLPGSPPAPPESAAAAQAPQEPWPEPVTTATSGLEAETDTLSEPKAEPEAEPEPKAELKPEAEPEPEAEQETEPVSEPEPEPSPAAMAGAVAPSLLKPPPEVARPEPKNKPPPKPRVVKRAEAGKKGQAKKARAASVASLSLPAGTLSPPSGTPSAPIPAPLAAPSASQGGHAGPPGSGTTNDKAGSASRAKVEGAYLADLQRAIKRYQRYPDQARSEGREGSTTLTFVLLADGSFQEVKVGRTSGDQELDRAAIEALKRLNRFRPIPLEFGRRRWPLSVSIRFDLR